MLPEELAAEAAEAEREEEERENARLARAKQRQANRLEKSAAVLGTNEVEMWFAPCRPRPRRLRIPLFNVRRPVIHTFLVVIFFQARSYGAPVVAVVGEFRGEQHSWLLRAFDDHDPRSPAGNSIGSVYM